jgi:protein SCO1/2
MFINNQPVVMNKLILLLETLLIIVLSISCQNNLPLDKDLTKKTYQLINQDSVNVIFPDVIEGHITVIGFIYTHCPDICPLTTNNMYLTEKKLKEQGIDDVKFVEVSFDPERDTPSVLREFADIRGISFNNWMLLTGEISVVKDLLKRFDVMAVKTDEHRDEDGELSYSMMHTDRISLINDKGILRKNYKGSTLNFDEIINDIKSLKD